MDELNKLISLHRKDIDSREIDTMINIFSNVSADVQADMLMHVYGLIVEDDDKENEKNNKISSYMIVWFMWESVEIIQQLFVNTNTIVFQTDLINAINQLNPVSIRDVVCHVSTMSPVKSLPLIIYMGSYWVDVWLTYNIMTYTQLVKFTSEWYAISIDNMNEELDEIMIEDLKWYGPTYCFKMLYDLREQNIEFFSDIIKDVLNKLTLPPELKIYIQSLSTKYNVTKIETYELPENHGRHGVCKNCKYHTLLLKTNDLPLILDLNSVLNMCTDLNVLRVIHFLMFAEDNTQCLLAADNEGNINGFLMGHYDEEDQWAVIEYLCSKGCGACLTYNYMDIIREKYPDVKDILIHEPVEEEIQRYKKWGFTKEIRRKNGDIEFLVYPNSSNKLRMSAEFAVPAQPKRKQYEEVEESEGDEVPNRINRKQYEDDDSEVEESESDDDVYVPGQTKQIIPPKRPRQELINQIQYKKGDEEVPERIKRRLYENDESEDESEDDEWNKRMKK